MQCGPSHWLRLDAARAVRAGGIALFLRAVMLWATCSCVYMWLRVATIRDTYTGYMAVLPCSLDTCSYVYMWLATALQQQQAAGSGSSGSSGSSASSSSRQQAAVPASSRQQSAVPPSS